MDLRNFDDGGIQVLIGVELILGFFDGDLAGFDSVVLIMVNSSLRSAIIVAVSSEVFAILCNLLLFLCRQSWEKIGLAFYLVALNAS